MLWYSIAPAAVGAVMAAAAVVAIVFASASIDYWTVMRFFGSRGVTLAPDAWKDHAFSRSLPFYLFHLPFYSDMLGFAFGFAILCALVFWPTAQGP